MVLVFDSAAHVRRTLQTIHRRPPGTCTLEIQNEGSHLIEFLDKIKKPVRRLTFQGDSHEPVPGIGEAIVRVLERGMVNELTLLNMENSVPEPTSPVSLRVLQSFHHPVNDIFPLVKSCARSLESFELYGTEQHDRLSDLFTCLWDAHHLRELALGNILFHDDVRGLGDLCELIYRLQDLTHLEITECLYFCPDHLFPPLWNAIQAHRGLRELTIHDDQIPPEQIPAFTEMILSIPNLDTLNLYPENGVSWDTDELDPWSKDDMRLFFYRVLSRPGLTITAESQNVYHRYAGLLRKITYEVNLLLVLASAKRVHRIGRRSPVRELPSELVRLIGDCLFDHSEMEGSDDEQSEDEEEEESEEESEESEEESEESDELIDLSVLEM